MCWQPHATTAGQVVVLVVATVGGGTWPCRTAGWIGIQATWWTALAGEVELSGRGGDNRSCGARWWGTGGRVSRDGGKMSPSSDGISGSSGGGKILCCAGGGGISRCIIAAVRGWS